MPLKRRLPPYDNRKLQQKEFEMSTVTREMHCRARNCLILHVFCHKFIFLLTWHQCFQTHNIQPVFVGSPPVTHFHRSQPAAALTSGAAFRHLQENSTNQHTNIDVEASSLPSASILPNLATLPGAALHTTYTFEEQDRIFCPLIPRYVAGFVQHLALEHNHLRVCKYPNNKTYLPATSNEPCRDRTPTLSEVPRSNFLVPFSFPPGQHTFHWQKRFRSTFHTSDSSI